METTAAVYVQNAWKSYGKKEVLKELNMQVKKGTIYGLLGASGCGKTTLLSCIVGRKQLDSGEIYVLGGKPGMEGSGVPGPRVGYMPQDVALVGEFTVKDALYYFGRILNMADKLIEERFEKLSKLLDLPPNDRYIKNCSGGQQRRVSFACAMVHLPELLILDEPTVGVDPVLRERMWNYLVEVTNTEKMSVIITTHYIEEARQADTIGLMRDGKLLAEDSPSNLLMMFGTETLEEVFLILSKRQEEGRLSATATFQNNLRQIGSDSISSFEVDHGIGSTDVLTRNKKRKEPKPISSFSLNGKRIKALMDKNWKQFYRNTAGVCFILMFPVLEILAFFLAIGADIKDINFGVVNDESMTTLCPDFNFNGTAIPYSWSSCHFRNMSCRFLEYLEDPMIHKVHYDTIKNAMEDARHGKIVGAIYFPHNFTESLEKRIEDGSGVEVETVHFGEMKVWLDMSNRQIGATIKYKLYHLYENFQKDLFRDCNFSQKVIDYINLKTIYGEKDDIYTIFMTPGVVLTILFFMGAVMTSQIIITDRCEGVWDRSTIAGVSSLEITLTHFILQASIVVVHTFEVLIITFAFFQIEYIGSMWIIALLSFLQGVAGMSYGFWISVVSYNHSMANIVTTGSFYPMIIVCGLVWPLEAMPVALQWISKCLPFTVAITSLRNVMRKGWTLDNLQVLNGIAMEILWIIGLSAITVYLIKRKR